MLPHGRDILSLWGRGQEQQNLTVVFIISIVLDIYICEVSQEQQVILRKQYPLKKNFENKAIEIQHHAEKEHANEKIGTIKAQAMIRVLLIS